MTRGRVGILVYLVVSVLLGLGAGEWFFRLFDQVVPKAVSTDFNRAAARGYFLFNGALLGVGMCIWGLLAVLLAPVMREKAASPRP